LDSVPTYHGTHAGGHHVFERIVSQDFDVTFLILLERYEVGKRAGSGLIYILIMFSNLNLAFYGKKSSAW
jgi:hypothetical protein